MIPVTQARIDAIKALYTQDPLEVQIRKISRNLPRSIRAKPPAARKAYMWEQVVKLLRRQNEQK